MTELLKNHVAGQWIAGSGAGATLTDSVTGEALVRVSSAGLDFAQAFGFACGQATRSTFRRGACGRKRRPRCAVQAPGAAIDALTQTTHPAQA